MASDRGENAPDLLEVSEEIVETNDRQQLEGLFEPDIELNLETKPVTMNYALMIILRFRLWQTLPASPKYQDLPSYRGVESFLITVIPHY